MKLQNLMCPECFHNTLQLTGFVQTSNPLQRRMKCERCAYECYVVDRGTHYEFNGADNNAGYWNK